MRADQFTYDLPPALIAQRPLPERGASRLLALDGETGRVQDLVFADLPALLHRADLLVFNDTRVMRARLRGRKPTGGKVEILVERVLAPDRFLAQLSASRPVHPGARLELAADVSLDVLGRDDDFFELSINGADDVHELMARVGEVPLPPYIQRSATGLDESRYQTVFARRDGAVAAPTAGLHFDEEMLATLEARGVERAMITLHVGAGTFQPVRAERLEEHRMHPERIEISPSTSDRLARARRLRRRVVAVGTTCVRALETASRAGTPAPFDGESRLFIRPGHEFRGVDALITNFHLPRSTLLMLVCAFAGTDHVLDAYHHAVRERYRFFSYGDAMFVTPAHPLVKSADYQ